jgi:hypothetical protein
MFECTCCECVSAPSRRVYVFVCVECLGTSLNVLMEKFVEIVQGADYIYALVYTTTDLPKNPKYFQILKNKRILQNCEIIKLPGRCVSTIEVSSAGLRDFNLNLNAQRILFAHVCMLLLLNSHCDYSPPLIYERLRAEALKR